MLSSKTKRVQRGWLDRLKGMDRLYQTTITDGYRKVTGRGETPEASQRSAHKTWLIRFGQATATTEYTPVAPIVSDEENSTSPATLNEVIDALKADLGEIVDTLSAGDDIKRQLG
jgi:hypothetical protein